MASQNSLDRIIVAVSEIVDDLQSTKASSDREPERRKQEEGIDIDNRDREPKRTKLEEGIQACIDKDDIDMDDSDSCGYDDGRYDKDPDDVSSVDYSEDETISEEENKVFRQYLNQIKKSEGFDVDIFPKRAIGGLRVVDMDAYSDEIRKCAEYAIKCHNDKKPEKLEFLRALKVIEGSTNGFMYFITLEARVKSTGKTRIYQAQVQDNFLSDKMIFYIFRPKPGQD